MSHFSWQNLFIAAIIKEISVCLSEFLFPFVIYYNSMHIFPFIHVSQLPTTATCLLWTNFTKNTTGRSIEVLLYYFTLTNNAFISFIFMLKFESFLLSNHIAFQFS